MAMCVVVTRDVPARFRGFLASCMLEIAPGVYTQPDMSAAVRQRVWRVMRSWWAHYFRGSVVMTWADPASASRQSVVTLGIPAKDIVEYEGMYLVRHEPQGGASDDPFAKHPAVRRNSGTGRRPGSSVRRASRGAPS